MANVIIREFCDLKRAPQGGYVDVTPEGWLASDLAGRPIATLVVAGGGGTADAPALGSQTHYIEIETDAPVRFAVRPPKGTYNANYATLVATAQHRLVPAGVSPIIAVYPGAVISFYGV